MRFISATSFHIGVGLVSPTLLYNATTVASMRY
jgi:hypothetical protein